MEKSYIFFLASLLVFLIIDPAKAQRGFIEVILTFLIEAKMSSFEFD
ncbi:MAG: hypothetical protein KDC94_11835 [Aequorivita sp.]|nr:hypothetical protein [Aequorivita sp.]